MTENSIVLTEDEAQEFAYGDHPNFVFVDEICDYEDLYKDQVPATTICKRVSDDTFWSLDWSKYVSHYGYGESSFYDTTITKVEKVVTERLVVDVDWVPIKGD